MEAERRTEMGQWEYRTIRIRYDRKEHKNWVVERTGKPPLVGLQAVLDAYGSRGWDLVSLGPERFQAYAGFAKWIIEPAAYRATFKRPAEG
jgi:hypothetical protein